MSDAINHPKHYTSRDVCCPSCGAPIECIDVAERFPFSIGNVLKYVWRAGLKSTSTAVEDLQKAEWYLRREIGRMHRETDKGEGGK